MAAVSLRTVVRVLSELCVTVGVLIVLFVVHVLYWSGIRAEAAGDGEIGRLRDEWATVAEDRDTEQPGGGARPAEYRDGEPFAVMHIPRLGDGWAKPVLHNTRKETLSKGLGHYENSTRLGERGNFAVAGHRRTHGDPFKDFPRLRPGDPVVVSDGETWFIYRIDRRPHRTVPTDTGVLDPLPDPLDRDAAPYDRPGRYLTLTTCEPEWGSSHRLIAWAHLDATQPVVEGKPEALPDLPD